MSRTPRDEAGHATVGRVANPGDVRAALAKVTAALPAAEERPGQQEMAVAVSEAIASGKHLIVQAGTGTGKTMGYLVPAVLTGKRIVVSAGPTYEDIDPVRFIGNRSSGRMGFAIAAEATRRGAMVTLVAGPTTVAVPQVAQVVRVRGAEQMCEAVLQHSTDADVVVMAAAVADYTPVVRAEQKVAKREGDVTLVLTRTPDILKMLGQRRAVSGGRTVLVGFAAETENVIASATEKLRTKQVDLIVANDVSRSDAGFDVDANEVTLVSEEGSELIPLQSKASVAAQILNRIEQLLVVRAQAAVTVDGSPV